MRSRIVAFIGVLVFAHSAPFVAVATPDSAISENNLGVSCINAKDYNGAIAAFSKAIELDPAYDLPWTNRV